MNRPFFYAIIILIGGGIGKRMADGEIKQRNPTNPLKSRLQGANPCPIGKRKSVSMSAMPCTKVEPRVNLYGASFFLL